MAQTPLETEGNGAVSQPTPVLRPRRDLWDSSELVINDQLHLANPRFFKDINH
jgi:hypothetical protein